VVVDSLKALDPKRPIREADIVVAPAKVGFLTKSGQCPNKQRLNQRAGFRYRLWEMLPVSKDMHNIMEIYAISRLKFRRCHDKFPWSEVGLSKMMQLLDNTKIWVTGHRGMLGSALLRNLASDGPQPLVASRSELDLTDRAGVLSWMEKNRPELVFHVAAKVGGIHANSKFPADFLRENLLIQSNVMEGAQRIGVRKLIFVASNCVYPEQAPQPISENELFKGSFERNVRAYAVSKTAGIELCRAYNSQYGCDFVSAIPPNLYGPGDNYDPQNSHIVAGLMRRAHEAKVMNQPQLVVWGDGTPRREILHVDDVASGLRQLMAAATTFDVYNIGCGHDYAVSGIAQMIADIVGFKGQLVFDPTKPNGNMGKLLDNSRISALGWKPRISEKMGLTSSYLDYIGRIDDSKIVAGTADRRG
jgi:GDP-L-fucose synthase